MLCHIHRQGDFGCEFREDFQAVFDGLLQTRAAFAGYSRMASVVRIPAK